MPIAGENLIPLNFFLHTLTDHQPSNYLKHLEKQGLIESEYRYAGTSGKTREIKKGLSIS
jgi:hypothetical protein